MYGATAKSNMTIEQFKGHYNQKDGLQAFEECRWKDAISCLREVNTLYPNQPEIAGKLAFALSQNKEYDKAIEVLVQIWQVQISSHKWPYMVGYQYYMKGAWEQAIQWFDKALSLNQTYIKALYRKGYAHFQLGQYDECLKSIMTCIQSWHRLSTEFKQKENKYYGKANFLLGKAYFSQGLSLKARRPFQVAVQVDGDDPDRRYELGKCYLKNGDIMGAILELEQSNALKPGTDYVIDRLAQAYAQDGDLNKAEELYSTIPKYRRRPFILKSLGELYFKQKRFEESLEILQMAFEKDRKNHNVQFLIGKALEAIGRYNSAMLAYKSAVDLKRKNYGSELSGAQTALERLISEMPQEDSVEQKEAFTGVVEHYNSSKGFGFISSLGQKLFFHITAIMDRHIPEKGEFVTFEIEHSEKGPRAIKVKLVENNK
jgi:tetratricopeptide (TPR) repeat protein